MNEEDDIFNGLGIEVSLKERDDFLKIKETLTRIGVSSRKCKSYLRVSFDGIKNNFIFGKLL